MRWNQYFVFPTGPVSAWDDFGLGFRDARFLSARFRTGAELPATRIFSQSAGLGIVVRNVSESASTVDCCWSRFAMFKFSSGSRR